MPAPIRVLFVCLGNICRSPMAESIFVQLVKDRGLSDKILVDGAGTGHWHEGEPPDRRTILELKRNGIAWASRARQVRVSDFEEFDLIVVMDRQNERDLLRLGAQREKVRLMMSYAPETGTDEVPDPYYGTQRDFEEVYALVYPACERLLDSLTASGD